MQKNEVKDQRIELRLSKSEKEKIEKLSLYLEIPPSTLLRNLIISSFDDEMIYKKLSVLKGATKMNEFKNKFSLIFKPTLPGF